MPPKRQKRTRPGNINPRYSRLPKPRSNSPPPPPPVLHEVLPRQPWLKKLQERELGHWRSTEPIVFQKLRRSRTIPDWNPHHQMKTFGEFQEHYQYPEHLQGPDYARTQTYEQWYDEMRALKAYNNAPNVHPLPTDRLEKIRYPLKHFFADRHRMLSENLPLVGYQVHPVNPDYAGLSVLHRPGIPFEENSDLKAWNPIENYQPSEDAPYVIK